MTINQLIHGGASGALILASVLAGSYVLLVLIVLIKPSSARGKAAGDLLSLHPLSKRNPDHHRSQKNDTSTP